MVETRRRKRRGNEGGGGLSVKIRDDRESLSWVTLSCLPSSTGTAADDGIAQS